MPCRSGRRTGRNACAFSAPGLQITNPIIHTKNMLRLIIRRSKKIFAAEIVSIVSSEERTACAACRRRRLRRAPGRRAKAALPGSLAGPLLQPLPAGTRSNPLQSTGERRGGLPLLLPRDGDSGTSQIQCPSHSPHGAKGAPGCRLTEEALAVRRRTEYHTMKKEVIRT